MEAVVAAKDLVETSRQRPSNLARHIHAPVASRSGRAGRDREQVDASTDLSVVFLGRACGRARLIPRPEAPNDGSLS